MREWNVPVPVDCTALEPSEYPTPEELADIERRKNAAVSWLYRHAAANERNRRVHLAS